MHGTAWNSRHPQLLTEYVLLSYHLRLKNHQTIHWEKGFKSCTGGWSNSHRTLQQFQCGYLVTNYMPTSNLAQIILVSCTTESLSNLSRWRVDVQMIPITSFGLLDGFAPWSSVLRKLLEQSVQSNQASLLAQSSVVGKGAFLCLLLRAQSIGSTAVSSREELLLCIQSMLRWRSILIFVGVRPELASCRILSHQNPNLLRAGKGKGFDTLPYRTQNLRKRHGACESCRVLQLPGAFLYAKRDLGKSIE